jgi:hypothetical protein
MGSSPPPSVALHCTAADEATCFRSAMPNCYSRSFVCCRGSSAAAVVPTWSCRTASPRSLGSGNARGNVLLVMPEGVLLMDVFRSGPGHSCCGHADGALATTRKVLCSGSAGPKQALTWLSYTFAPLSIEASGRLDTPAQRYCRVTADSGQKCSRDKHTARGECGLVPETRADEPGRLECACMSKWACQFASLDHRSVQHVASSYKSEKPKHLQKQGPQQAQCVFQGRPRPPGIEGHIRHISAGAV